MTGTALFALSGEEVFKQKCASCHDYYIPQTKLNTNYEHNNTDLKLKAPTLTELSFRLKDQVGDRTTDAEGQKFEIEEFLTIFFKDPASNKKSILKKQTRKVFGQMPPVEVDEDEVEALADFMYDYAEQMMIRHGVKRYSYEEALRKAKAEGKIILIEGYIPFCRGCIWMDRNVMVEPGVKEVLNRDFVLVKMNLLLEKLPLGMKRLGTPSFYFIDPSGEKVIDMLEGTGTVEEFLSLLKRISSRVK
jgi:thioredoxin-related protein